MSTEFNKHKLHGSECTRTDVRKVVEEVASCLVKEGIDFSIIYLHPSSEDEIQVVTPPLSQLDVEQQDNSFLITVKL